jgi:hypothetical protein
VNVRLDDILDFADDESIPERAVILVQVENRFAYRVGVHRRNFTGSRQDGPETAPARARNRRRH